MTRHRTMPVVAIALATAITLSGCGQSAAPTDTPSPTATGSSQPSPPAPEPSPSAAPQETSTPFPDAVQDSSAPGSTDAFHVVAALDTAAHPGFDRVVVDLTGTGTPGWTAAFVAEPIVEPTDHRAPLTGDSFLNVSIPHIDWSGEQGVADYAGLNPIPGGAGSQVTGVYYGGAVEGTGQLLIALDGPPRPFRIFTLTEPTRLVIDIAN